jgi:hypothetical protein
MVAPPDSRKESLRSSKENKSNEPQTVSVQELPTVSISKGWEDWVLWGAQIALAIVGGFGIRYAYKTLKATEDAAIAAKDSAQAALNQTGHMIAKERARLVIDRIPPSDETEENPQPGTVVISNQGPTYAFDVFCRINFLASREQNLTQVPDLIPQEVPTVLKSLQEHRLPQWDMFSLLSDDRPDDGDDPVRNEKAFLHIYVVVSYCDIFGKMPDSILHMRWNVVIEEIETGDDEYPFDQRNYSKWIRVPTPEASKPN